MFPLKILDYFRALPRPLRLGAYGLAVSIVLYLCLAPTKNVPGADLIWDKAAHAITWAILAGSGYVLTPRRRTSITIFALGLGAAIEVAQSTMGFGRQGDWRDFAADSLGVAAALAAYLLARRIWKPQ